MHPEKNPSLCQRMVWPWTNYLTLFCNVFLQLCKRCCASYRPPFCMGTNAEQFPTAQATVLLRLKTFPCMLVETRPLDPTSCWLKLDPGLVGLLFSFSKWVLLTLFVGCVALVMVRLIGRWKSSFWERLDVLLKSPWLCSIYKSKSLSREHLRYLTALPSHFTSNEIVYLLEESQSSWW